MNPQMTVSDAMTFLAKYSKRDMKTRRIRQATSKKKNRLKEAALQQNSNVLIQLSVSNYTATLSSVTMDSNTTTNNQKRVSKTIVSASMQSKKLKMKQLPQI
jgi:hypothetical protein